MLSAFYYIGNDPLYLSHVAIILPFTRRSHPHAFCGVAARETKGMQVQLAPLTTKTPDSSLQIPPSLGQLSNKPAGNLLCTQAILLRKACSG